VAWDPGKALNPERPRHTRGGLCMPRVFRRGGKRGVRPPRWARRWASGLILIALGIAISLIAAAITWLSPQWPGIEWLWLTTGILSLCCMLAGLRKLGVRF